MEGGLNKPERYNVDWNNPDFLNEELYEKELRRVADACHGCRRCVSLCNSFPTLFDLIDESETFEVDGVSYKDFEKVVDHCYLCDLCFMTKCPYVPPHEWEIDFPHLMLRGKTIKFNKNKPSFRDSLLTSSDMLGKLGSKAIIAPLINFFYRIFSKLSTSCIIMIHIIDVHIITYFAVSEGNSVSTEMQRLSVEADSLPPPPFLVKMLQNKS